MDPPVGVPGHGRGQPRGQVEPAGVAGPAPGGPQVVQPHLDPVGPGRLVGAVQSRLGPFGEVDQEAAVAAPGQVGLVGGEPVGGVGPQGLQHPVAADAAGPGPGQHGPLGQPGHQVGDPAGGKVVVGRDRFRGRDVERGREHRQAQEQPLLVGIEQLEGPVDDAAKGVVAGVAAAAAGPEQVEARVQPIGEVVYGQGADAGGGQLDGQGEAVQGAADVADPAQEPPAGRDLGAGGARPVEEQPDRGVVHRLGARCRDRQGWDHQHLLAAGGQPLAAGREHHQPGRGGQQRLGELGDGAEQVLAVVDHQQPPGPPRPPAERLLKERPRSEREVDAHGVGDGVGHGAGVAERGQVDPPHGVVAAGDLPGQAGLADPARADQRHQRPGGQGLADQGELPLPAHERGRGEGRARPSRPTGAGATGSMVPRSTCSSSRRSLGEGSSPSSSRSRSR